MVQGVAFRFFVDARAAAKACTAGWKTCRMARGDAPRRRPSSVDRVEAALWRGPSGAAVDDVAARRRRRRDEPQAFRLVPVLPTRIRERLRRLKSKIRHVPDFPKAGILFYDVTTLLRDPKGFGITIDSLANPYQGRDISLVVGIESRGFILGAAVADRIGAGFVPVRKVGKLPSKTVKVTLRSRVRRRLPRDAQRRNRAGAMRGDRR